MEALEHAGGYRDAAITPAEPLIFPRKWWHLWRRKTFVAEATGQVYRFHFTRRWKSGRASDSAVLYYTTNGRWVLRYVNHASALCKTHWTWEDALVDLQNYQGHLNVKRVLQEAAQDCLVAKGLQKAVEIL